MSLGAWMAIIAIGCAIISAACAAFLLLQFILARRRIIRPPSRITP